MKINVLFPMAGDGTRFGGTQFKPFLDGTEKLFIELAKAPFDQYKHIYNIEFFFIYRQDQEDTYNVSAKLKSLFPNDALHFCILPDKTSGPAETLVQAIQKYLLSGAAFVCDCDHAINIQPMISFLETQPTPDILVPLLQIKESEQHNFGKVKLDKQNKPLGFYEKEIVPFSNDYDVKGLVGCYFFKELSDVVSFPTKTNISDLLPLYNQTRTIQFVDILEAGLFGTPESLITYRFGLAKRMTFFVDIDGTLIYLPKHISYDSSDAKLLPGAIEQLTKWKQQGHSIVLTTGRETARREKLMKLLEELKVPYDQLITNLRPGPRILINDKKPYSELHQMARAIQIRRNQGIAHIHIEETPDILEKLKGGSFANTYLICKNNTKIVRKYIEKSKENTIHVETLRRQHDDLLRLNYYSPGLVPTILCHGENENEFYYDMEYLENYKELSHFPLSKREEVVQRVLQKLHADVYCFAKEIDGQKWIQEFLQEKIVSKYSYIESLGPVFFDILNKDMLTINGKLCKGLRRFFEHPLPKILCPTRISPIHGDLTCENILYNEETDRFYLIDTSGARYVDSQDMDIAKLLQSFLAKYETWDTRTDIQESTCIDSYALPYDIATVSKEQFQFLQTDPNDSFIFERSLFMLACYFIRMTPFLIKKSTTHAVFGLILSTYYLSFLDT
jgi:thiamine kinase-like enzyme